MSSPLQHSRTTVRVCHHLNLYVVKIFVYNADNNLFIFCIFCIKRLFKAIYVYEFRLVMVNRYDYMLEFCGNPDHVLGLR